MGSPSQSKFSGIVLLPVLFGCIWLGPPRWRRWLVLPVPLLTYVGVFSFALYWQRVPHGLRAVWENTAWRYRVHAGMDGFVHPFCSQWSSWLWGGHPYPMSKDVTNDGALRVSENMGNLVIWAGASLLVIGMVAWWVSGAARRKPFPRLIWQSDQDWRAAWYLFLFWLLPIVPWMATRRDSYNYHYLPAYVFGVILVAGALLRLYRYRPLLGLAAFLVCFDVFAYYVPVWAQVPVSRTAFEQRVFVRRWR